MTKSALKLPRPPEGLIDTPAALAEVCNHLATANVFGFDTEFIRESSYQPVLCLVQVATNERAELIDPLALEDLGPFWDLLADPSIEKICHGGEQDLSIAWQLGRKAPQNVFDCQIGAGQVGIGYQEPYWRLVEIVAGIRLEKAQRFTDWNSRPLSASQLTYAVDDVAYLPEIHRMLQGQIGSLGRMAWMHEACRDACSRAATDLDTNMIFASIKGASGLAPWQLSVLRELTILREQIAHRRNMPARSMLRDEALMDLALAGPESAKHLSRIRSLPGDRADRYADQIIRAIQRGKALPPDQRPSLPPQPVDSAETRRLADIMYASSQVICLGQSVSPSLVTSRAEIEGLARLVSQGEDLSGHALMTGWTRECLGAPLMDLVRGKTGVSLRVAPGRMHAKFEPLG